MLSGEPCELVSALQLNRLPEMRVDENRQVVAEVADRVVRYGEVNDDSVSI
jgi:hypothetical protein